MNNFQLTGVDFLDLPNTQRAQIPSVADTDLRGFSDGFASGKYGVLVPFYNAIFSGKLARMQIVSADMSKDVQTLDTTIMPVTQSPNLNEFYRGFRGGFVSRWPAAVLGE